MDLFNFTTPGYDFSEMGADELLTCATMLADAGASQVIVHPMAKRCVQLWSQGLIEL